MNKNCNIKKKKKTLLDRLSNFIINYYIIVTNNEDKLRNSDIEILFKSKRDLHKDRKTKIFYIRHYLMELRKVKIK